LASRIKILPERLANQIAAGEVVERPASVVKELVENALDAGAGRVFVEVQSGGTKLISVSDDGQGMGPDDALLAFERHATSKISTSDDLTAITTLGFRGEAIPSIASVSRMRLTTSTGDGSPGTLVVTEGGKVKDVRQTGAPRGTSVEVRDLFFNTPARLKFLKSRQTEFSHIASTLEKVALANPGLHIRLVHEGRTVLDCTPVAELGDRAAQVYGREHADNLVEVRRNDGPYSVSGFICAPGVSYADKSRQELFVNRRPVKSPLVVRAVYDAYRSVLMKDRHPAFILFVDVDPSLVDVNVHPAKREVRFSDNRGLHVAVYDAVSRALSGADIDRPYADTDVEPLPAGRVMQERVRYAVEKFMDRADSAQDRFHAPVFAPSQQEMRLPRTAPQERPQPPAEPMRDVRHQVLQVADTYIIIPADDGYMVVDQHAAHERIQYERVKKSFGKKGLGVQGLLVPERISLSAKQAAVMDGIMHELAEIGIEVEHFGGTDYVIRTKPLFLDKSDIKEVVMGLLAEMDEADVKSGVEELREKVYQVMACKSAVKAGQKLHPEAIARLISQLFECDMPYTCAHGRPTVINYGLAELEKLFRRK
jgi:DNA mismatch repair protein MutL